MLITLIVVYITRRIRAGKAARLSAVKLQIAHQSNLNVK
ncbi:hypothetical protein MuYL_0882 [Mucilaginibacter xinganensis]|uniref:Uncharacterized protein n=1 Tax=Mucilaginibacter xinganensis TaxID=1234841 RepID=A0A223NSC3_9SPHI|nr:hypothetical protein MuYL_0882 [Mucilaginibacter xinganensis]